MHPVIYYVGDAYASVHLLYGRRSGNIGSLILYGIIRLPYKKLIYLELLICMIFNPIIPKNIVIVNT